MAATAGRGHGESGRVAALAGATAAAFPLALLWAGSRVADAVVFPPLALAERLIRITPGDAATLAIERLGEAAKPLLALGALVLFLVFGAVAGSLAARRTRRAVPAAGAAFGIVAAAAALAQPPAGASLASAAGVLAVAGILFAVVLELTLAARPAHAEAPAAGGLTRRAALAAFGSATVALAGAGTLFGPLLGRSRGPDRAVRIRPPDVPARASRGGRFSDIAGLSEEVTATSDHYVVDIDLRDPVVEAGSWRLVVEGEVERPLALGFEALQDEFELVEEVSVLTCVSNTVGGPLVGNSAWTGVRLGEVLRRARPSPAAVDVVFRCADGYDVSVPLERALERSALLAIAQNGRPLTQEHGFPCRLRIPALYGMMNAKWIRSIEVVSENHRGYWADRGWSETGEVRTQSRIDTPRTASVGEPTLVAGVAWAGIRGISAVEVSLDEGETWRRAELRRPLSEVAWTQWALEWTPSRRGEQRVMCRAVDGDGTRQDWLPRRPHPDGATGYHDVSVVVG